MHDVTDVLLQIPSPSYGDRRGDRLIANLPQLVEELTVLADRTFGLPLEEVVLRAPIGEPGKLIGAPNNYHAHLAEMADTAPSAFLEGVDGGGMFLKATSSLIGCSEPITLGFSDRRTDHEIELAIVIGKVAKNVTPQTALAYVAGYCVGLDITLRGPEERSFRKSLDTYSVLGPYLVTADELGNPDDLALALDVNGLPRQRGNTRDLIVDVPGLVARCSSWYTLLPGDVIFSGTPSGVGPLEPGDTICASIERIGSIDVSVVASL